MTEQGNQQTVDSLAHRLEESGTDNSQGRRKKAQRNDSQSRHADLQHISGSIEDRQQNVRPQPEDKHPHPHQNECDHTAVFDCGIQAVFLSRSEIISHDGHQALIQTEHRHKHKGLQLKVNAEERHGGHRVLGEGEQDRVHSHYHHRTNGLHDDSREPNCINFLDNAPIRLEATEIDIDRVILENNHKQRDQHS